MDCKKFEKLIPDYLSGDISDEKLQEFTNHLHECSNCENEVEALENVWSSILELPEYLPSGQMRQRFYGMLEAYKAGISGVEYSGSTITEKESNVKSLKPEGVYEYLKIAAVIVFMVIGSTGVIQMYRSNDLKSSEISAMQTEILNLNKMVTISMLKGDSPSERLKGVKSISRMNYSDELLVDALFRTMEEDPNMNVRLASVDAFYSHVEKSDTREQLLGILLKETSPAIQRAIIDLVIAIKEEKAIQTFDQMLENEDLQPEIKQRLEQGKKLIRS